MGDGFSHANILREISTNKFKFLILPITLLVTFLLYRKFMLLILLIAVVMIWDYFQHSIRLTVHLDLLPFVSLFVTSQYGLLVSIPFILISGIIPEIAAGHFEMSDTLSVLPILIVNIIFSGGLISDFDSVAYLAALTFVFVQTVFAFVAGEPTEKKIIEPIAVIILSVIFIARIAPILSLFV